jgi:hypothetical protein
MIISVFALMAATMASDGSAAPQATTVSPPAATSTAPAPKVQDPNDKMVCRTILPTGSRLGGTKVCKTQGEWAEISRNARNMVTSAQMSGMQTGVKGN